MEAGAGLAFQSGMVNNTFTIELLSGIWNGTSASVGITERGGNLIFHNINTSYVQLSHNFGFGLRLQYEGIVLTVLDAAHSWNGTLPADTDIYLKWGFALTMPHEANFELYVGVSGIGLLLVSVMLLAWGLRKYPLFSMDKESLLEKDILPFIGGGLILGIGLIIIWLMV